MGGYTRTTVLTTVNGIRIAASFPGADMGAKVSAAIADLAGAGGTVDARGLTGVQGISTTVIIPAKTTVILGPVVCTCTVQAFSLEGTGAELLGQGAGVGTDGADPGVSDATGVSNLIGSGLGAAVDMVRIAIPAGSRADQATSRLHDAVVSGIYINMGNTGRHGVYATSTHTSRFTDLQIFNVADGGSGFKLEGDLSTSTFLAAAFENILELIVSQPRSSNATGFGLHLDATTAEIAWTSMRNCRFSGNITNGGGLAAVYMETGTANEHTINHTVYDNCYIGNPTDAAGSYGLKMKAAGNYPLQGNGRVADVSVRDTLIERLFAAANGVGIGCVTSVGPDVRGGLGCGAIALINSSASANWGVVGLDWDNLGSNYIEVTGSTNTAGGQATIRAAGITYGLNASVLNCIQTMLANANSDSMFGVASTPKVNANGKTGLNVFGSFRNWGTFTAGGGSAAAAYTDYIDAPTFATANWAYYAGSGVSRVGDFFIWGGQSRVSSIFTKTTSTVLADVTGLTATLVAGKTYRFRAHLFVDADATGGHKYAIGGTATATAIIYEIRSVRNSTLANTITSRQTAIGGSAGEASGTAYLTIIEGLITVNAAGTLTVQFAQNASNLSSSVLVGSTFEVNQIL